MVNAEKGAMEEEEPPKKKGKVMLIQMKKGQYFACNICMCTYMLTHLL